MFRNYLAAALRNMVRNKLYAAIKATMALAEVQRCEAAKKLFPFRPQVLRRMFTERRRIA